MLPPKLYIFTCPFCTFSLDIYSYAAQKKYDAEKVKHYHLKLNKEIDSDIIEKLEAVESKNGFIKDCIRQALKEIK